MDTCFSGLFDLLRNRGLGGIDSELLYRFMIGVVGCRVAVAEMEVVYGGNCSWDQLGLRGLFTCEAYSLARSVHLLPVDFSSMLAKL